MTRPWSPLLDERSDLYSTARILLDDITHALADAPRSRADLGGGLAGQALLFAYRSFAFPAEDDAARALALVEQALAPEAELAPTLGLYAGAPGVAWLLEHLRDTLVDLDADANQDTDEALARAVTDEPEAMGHDLLAGLTGAGVYALARLPSPRGRALLERVVAALGRTAHAVDGGLAWRTTPRLVTETLAARYPSGYRDLGMAHGAAGVIALLARACVAGIAAARPLLDGALESLLAHRLADGVPSRWPARVGADDAGPARAAWCYGDPGVAIALLAAARAVGESRWEAYALDAALAMTAAPVESCGVRDAGLCHGAFGLAHQLARLHHATGEARFADAARAWIGRGLAMRTVGEGPAGYRNWGVRADGTSAWLDDHGLLTGIAGIGLALLAAIAPVAPGWDALLLLDVE